MQSMPGKMQGLRKVRAPSPLDELKITFLRRSINLVAQQGVPEMREMNANLVGPPGFWHRPHYCKAAGLILKAAHYFKVCDRGPPPRGESSV